MTNREYWIMTEVFVYLHGGVDFCSTIIPECKHCKFIATTFDLPLWDDNRGDEKPVKAEGRPIYDPHK